MSDGARAGECVVPACNADPGAELRPRRWIWPLPAVSQGTARRIESLAIMAGRLVDGWYWMPVAMFAGAIPLLLSYSLRVPGHQWASALVLFVAFLGGVQRGAPLRTLGLLATAYAVHSAGVIALATYDPSGIAPLLPAAEEFWVESRAWVETGVNEEYAVHRWLLKHVLLFVAVVLLSYCSLGLTTLVRGFYEVDLMNFYVGQLITQSYDATTAAFYGWHIWSVARGLGYALITYEVAAVSYAALVGIAAPASRGRRERLAVGFGLVLLDGILKAALMNTVQARLQANLI